MAMPHLQAQTNQSNNIYSSCSALHDCLNPKNDANHINLSNNNTDVVLNAFNETGLNATGNGQFIHPLGIAVDFQGNNVYVVDNDNNRIQKFDSNGKYITRWGFEGSDNQQFSGPHGISVDLNDNVYVTDYNNNRIQKFDSNGKYITQ
jgi:DNA-binding beta-propeller fold protein YncE